MKQMGVCEAMKKILITGAGSYIGMQFEQYMQPFSEAYAVDTLDMLNENWIEFDLSGYDIVYHVAGIAHQKETAKNAARYYQVNRDLAVAVAKRAKEAGVRQFVFLSSMSVYGMRTGVITPDTVPSPISHYGRSKLEAEELLKKMETETFLVSIVRPPMVYGEGCKGNYQLLKKFALKSPIFPNIRNRRSMIRIDRLCAYIKKLMDHENRGCFFPQDPEYVCTSDMVVQLAKQAGRNIRLTKIFNPLIRILKIPVIEKVFGDLIYDNATMQ